MYSNESGMPSPSHSTIEIGGAMSINRKTRTVAALGGGTAALAMLTGLAGARADDLQLNQQLLNTRVDQLAAVGLAPDVYLGQPEPGRRRAGHRGQFPALDPDPRHRHLDQDLRADHRSHGLLVVGRPGERQPADHDGRRQRDNCSRFRC